MVRIIPASDRLSTREKFANAFSGAGRAASDSLGHYLNREDQMNAQQQNNLAKQSELLAKNNHDINLQDRKFQNEMSLLSAKDQQQSQMNAQKLAGENQDKLAPFIAGLDTIQQMKAIKNKGGIGVGSSISGLFSEETRRDRAQYSQLGKSLISLASSIPIRNQAEFNTLAEDLFDPSLSQAAMDGILDAMEQIITQNMQQYSQGGQNMQEPQQRQQPKANRPPLSSFNR